VAVDGHCGLPCCCRCCKFWKPHIYCPYSLHTLLSCRAQGIMWPGQTRARMSATFPEKGNVVVVHAPHRTVSFCEDSWVTTWSRPFGPAGSLSVFLRFFSSFVRRACPLFSRSHWSNRVISL
jgi:hypothetical protein